MEKSNQKPLKQFIENFEHRNKPGRRIRRDELRFSLRDHLFVECLDDLISNLYQPPLAIPVAQVITEPENYLNCVIYPIS